MWYRYKLYLNDRVVGTKLIQADDERTAIKDAAENVNRADYKVDNFELITNNSQSNYNF